MTKVPDKKFQGNALIQCNRLTVDRETNRGGMKEGKRMKRVWNEKRLWIFLVWGLVVSVCGLVTGGIYLNLRTLTSSEKYTEIIPNYVNFISVIIAGIMVLVLFWKRNVILVFSCVFVNVGAAFLNGISAILTGTLIIPPINQLLHCTFLSPQKQCHCLSPYSRSFVQLDYSIEEPVTLIFQDTSNCNDIEVILIQILYTLCGLCVVSAIACIISAILALMVLRMERRRKLGYQNSTYDEIFTISNSNTPDSSDSENEHNPNLVRPVLPSYSDLDRIESDTSANRLRSSLQRSHSLKAPKTESNNLDVVDNTTPKEKVTKGKLKEHRRRGQRAVTLHNLDSKQLMVILSLQMRYLKENEHSKSQVELSARKLDEQLRRSFTPQPYHSRPKPSESDVRKIRSHTPQPYKTKKQQMYENLQTANLNEFYENNFPPWERSQSTKAKLSKEKRKSSHIPHYEEIDDMRSYMSGDEDDRIYANQSEVKIQKKKKIKPKIPTDSEESEFSDIPPNRARRSHRKNTSSDLPINIPVQQNIIPNPGRPKSYIKAIDNPDPNPEDLYGQVNKHSSLINHAQSQPNHLNQPEYHNINEGRQSSEGIYAQPVKKMNPKAAFQRIPDSNSVPVINQPNLYQNTVERCSAFQVVQRSSEAGTGIVGYIDPVTRHNYQLYSAMERKIDEEKPPPYSPPPCYSDCTTTSRDSSSQSSSLSHHSNHSLPHHTYNQGNKHRPKFVYTTESNRPLLETQTGCSYSESSRNKPTSVHQQIIEPSPEQYRANIDNQPAAFSPPYRANYVINFDNEQPKVLLEGESSDPDEMETVI
ncbi:hypothetical protein LOTGIDRAFT_168095 [Lottia gigantea]|uniref:Uncharacterized protein n=1 Tax=Lottia gigantea TaxID=225164 RepID=V4B8J8_LOTGI|nr:hypothetical protein LOTGIDRAFT_168095 [Lottia gigantea]ESO85074.1 hypothetical protein LOTGIDRAFT_168095 [Lottia gigantea]